MFAVTGRLKVIPQRIYYTALYPALEYCCELWKVTGGEGWTVRAQRGGIIRGLLEGRQLVYSKERVSEGLTPKPFREESALETRGQWYKIVTVPSYKNCAFSCQLFFPGSGLAREGEQGREGKPTSSYLPGAGFQEWQSWKINLKWRLQLCD